MNLPRATRFLPEPDLRTSPPAASTHSDEERVRLRFDALVHALCPEAPPVDAICLQCIAALLRDPDWHCEPALRDHLEQLLAQARRAVPGTDAPAHWPSLLREIQAYADFQRLRRLEHLLRPDAGGHAFDRQDWERARGEETALRSHQRQVRDASYAPPPAGMFRVH